MDNPILRKIFCHIAATALLTCSPLPWWQLCLQEMLTKEKGNCIDKLWIIQLVEADLNFILKLIWGHHLNQAACNHLYNESQFAILGKTCTGAVLNKVPFADLTCQTKCLSCMTDNNNKATFNWIQPALSVVTCRHLGLPTNAVLFIFTLLHRMEFKVGNSHGVSTNSYGANDDPSNLHQGSGQGQGSGPMLYGTSADVILIVFNRHCTGALFQHPSNIDLPREDHVSQFVDDATQFVNSDGLEHQRANTISNSCHQDSVSTGTSSLTPIANRNSQKWSDYNWASGGKLNYEKCFWYLLHPILKGKKYCFASKDDLQGELNVTVPSNGTTMCIPHFEPSEAKWTLGDLFAPDGSNHHQIQHLKNKLQPWANSIWVTHLHANEKWIAYHLVLKPGILYPLPSRQCTASDLSPIQKIIDQEILHSQHLSTSVPCTVLWGPLANGSLGIASLHSETLSEKVVYFIHHIHQHDMVSHKLWCSLGHLQLEIGIGENVLKTQHDDLGIITTTSFVTDLWRECSTIGVTFWGVDSTLWVPNSKVIKIAS